MRLTWFKDGGAEGRVILAGDIGGTNTNLAVAVERGGSIELIMEAVFESAAVTDFTDCVLKTVETARTKLPQLKIELCCVSGAGPVKDNYCQLTNQKWAIDGHAVQKALGVPTLVINDFTAISYGLPLLNVSDEKQIAVLRRPDGSTPRPAGEMRAVFGAGTGLGVGFLTKNAGRWLAFPSEGGHMDFADFDDDSKAFKAWLTAKIGFVPEYELAISGMGIRSLFHFYVETGVIAASDPAAAAILKLPEADQPAAISKAASDDEGCRRVLRTFVKMYARLAASIACFLLPRAGVYLAGGISGKNLDAFTEDDLFVKTFEQHCNPNLLKVLKEIPLYIIKDYSISLYGAANAALSLMV
jgi:glucokinase